ncbi:RNA-binding protein [bacterium]|nr:RNA-binding protein [bacterium]
MATRLYVGNLPFSTTEDELRTVFGEFGTVESAELVIDRMSGRPRGFGFVQMDTEGAATAIKKLDGVEMGGRAMNVNEAKERTQSRPERRGRSNW